MINTIFCNSSKLNEILTQIAILLFLLCYTISLIKYIIKTKNFKFHKMDVFTLLISYTKTCLILYMKFFGERIILIKLVNIADLTLNTVICCLITIVQLWRLDMVYVRVMNWLMGIVIILDIVYFVFEWDSVVLDVLGLIFDVGVVVVRGFSDETNNQEGNLVLVVDEDEFYINYVFASFITRVRNLTSMYIIFAGGFLISFSVDILGSIPGQEPDSGVYMCFLCFTLKEILPHFLIYLGVLVLRWK